MNYLLILTAVVPLVVGLKVENLQWMSQIVSYYEPIPDEVSQSCRRQVQQYLLDLTNSSSWAWTSKLQFFLIFEFERFLHVVCYYSDGREWEIPIWQFDWKNKVNWQTRAMSAKWTSPW